MSPLSSAILRTLCFADAMDMALTPLELHRFLGVDRGIRASPAEVFAALIEDADLMPFVAMREGFFTLAGREALSPVRRERLAITAEKWVVARRALGRLRHLPCLELAAVCNTVAMGNPRRQSDVDLFLIAAPGRLWTVRLLAHAALYWRGLARRGSSVRDRMCLSFFVTGDTLDLQSIAKPPTDPYLTIWLATLCPVIDRQEVYPRFWEKNSWCAVALPNAQPRIGAPSYRLTASLLARLLDQLLSGAFGRLVERLARRLQRSRILANPTSRVHFGGTDVVVTDLMLKFHEEDKREAIRDAFFARTARYGV